MGISFREWLICKLGGSTGTDVVCADMAAAMEECRIRELAFHTCVNMIANAIGKCEFKVYNNGKEHQDREYYVWNVEPNSNQNSTAFLHKLIYKLYSDNEALIICVKKAGGEMLAVADSYEKPQEQPEQMQTYRGVVVGDVSYQRPFNEKEVIHIRLQHGNVKPVLDGLCQAYGRLEQTARNNQAWANGKHLKVHVDQIAQAGKSADGTDWNTNFTNMLHTQVKPFLTSENGVLPEFNGYKYENVGGNPDVNRSTRDIRALADDIFDFTARAFCIPPVLIFGDVAGTKDAMQRWLTTCIDPLCDQIQEEIIRKRYGFEEWKQGNFIRIDTVI